MRKWNTTFSIFVWPLINQPPSQTLPLFLPSDQWLTPNASWNSQIDITDRRESIHIRQEFLLQPILTALPLPSISCQHFQNITLIVLAGLEPTILHSLNTDSTRRYKTWYPWWIYLFALPPSSSAQRLVYVCYSPEWTNAWPSEITRQGLPTPFPK